MAGDFQVRNVEENNVTTCFSVCYSYNLYRTKELTSTILYSNGLLHRKNHISSICGNASHCYFLNLFFTTLERLEKISKSSSFYTFFSTIATI